jgi:hypothetical protein
MRPVAFVDGQAVLERSHRRSRKSYR